MANQIYALLVGIDRYANPRQAPHLRGCVADVTGTHNWLITTLGVPEENILLLTSPLDQSEPAHLRPTRENIIQGWREHLAQAGEGDQVFFNYSGHGAQARSVDPNELDGFDETLVAHDSRSNTPDGKPIYDILDKEIATLIHEVESRGAQVSVFLDCCHSGSGTRAIQQAESSDTGSGETARVRQCLPDLRQRPPSTLIDGFIAPVANTRSGSPSQKQWTPLGNHVLLAGCRDQELANEYRSPETDQWHGATTYFFHKALANYHPEMTWADIHDAVQTHVHNVYATQRPQLEGPSHLAILGGATHNQQRYLLITEVQKKEEQLRIRLNGGVAVGLTVGSQLNIYAPASDLTGDALASATVEQVRADHAWATLNAIPDAEIETASRVKIVSHGFDTMQHIVAVDAPAVQEQINQLNDGEPSAFLQIIPLTSDHTTSSGKPETPSATPEFRVSAEEQRYVIRDSSGLQIVDDTPQLSPEGAAQVAQSLEHLAVYRNVQLLHNPTPDAALRGAITISDPIIGYIGRNNKIVEEEIIPYRDGEFTIQDGQRVAFTIRNNSSETLYFALLNLDENFGISRYYPRQAPHATIAPGKEIAIPAQLELNNTRLTKGKEIFKLFATTDPVSFDVLQMPELNQGDIHNNERSRAGGSLGQLLDGVRHEGTRPARWPERDDTDDQWITDQIEIVVMGEERAQPLITGQTSVVLDETSNLILLKPADFSGTISLGSLEQTQLEQTRAIINADEPELILPPALTHSQASANLEPITIGESTRSLGTSPLVVTLESDGIGAVSPENPLQFALPISEQGDLQGIVPIAYDGQFYSIAGQSQIVESRSLDDSERIAQISISHLPTTIDDDEEAGQRGNIRRTMRLFFYKVFTGEMPQDSGLRKAEWIDSQVQYSEVTAEDVQNAQQIALLVHGINSESIWLVQKLWPLIQEPGGYDLCLTYDYETIGTGLQESAHLLSEALVGLGFGKDEKLTLDIYAHSMGTQVTRALVELMDGDRYVRRVFMGGPPNAGSVLAKANTLMPWLAALAVNFAASTSAAMLTKHLLGTAASAGQAINDLNPDSDFFQELNAQRHEPTTVPYYIQTGNSHQAYEQWSLLARQVMQGVDGGLDLIFGGEHDLVVSVESASTARSQQIEIEELPVNHFQYFHSEVGYATLMRWLSS